MNVREPVARPLDVIVAELIVSASQAYVAGVLLYLAVGIWDERGVEPGSVALILVLLGLAVGGAWLYWLLGGTGWPMAAVSVPVALYAGFTLVLAFTGGDLLALDPLPLLLLLAASIYGLGAGIFLDPPRHLRWDQRVRQRPGTQVPRISPATRAAVARIPRRIPTRPGAGTPESRSGTSPVVAAGAGGPAASARAERPETGRVSGAAPAAATRWPDDEESGVLGPARATGEAVPDGAETAGRGSAAATPGGTAARKPRQDVSSSEAELPTSVEPKAQRSPWAWARPPEWNREEEEEDDPAFPGSSS